MAMGTAAGGMVMGTGPDCARLPAQSTARTTSSPAAPGGSFGNRVERSNSVLASPAARICSPSATRTTSEPRAGSSVAKRTRRQSPTVSTSGGSIEGGVASTAASTRKPPAGPVGTGRPSSKVAPAGATTR